MKKYKLPKISVSEPEINDKIAAEGTLSGMYDYEDLENIPKD